MKPGAVMVTFERVLELGRTLSEENKGRLMRGLPESQDASFFECTWHSLGRNAVTWSYTNNVVVWVHRRVQQSTGSTALFLCNNKDCCKKTKSKPNGAVENADQALLREKCAFCSQPRLPCPRQKVPLFSGSEVTSDCDSDTGNGSSEREALSQSESSSDDCDDSSYRCSKSRRQQN
uniref:Uncharacterized protein n=2 Tax=Pseudictyota dubia TaxID=2749911 RepID=A0A7R9W1H5_9STRA|mmetsp:Transcript_27801/g.51772  ORF Transcript_27801/g.51772 Transcript_27801/m.51772 type:complete len:177 (+) Transcript_27801:258-788(+)